ncbi:MAG: hypothetical protein ABUL72_05205, partial [Armatimonadota bacterium]
RLFASSADPKVPLTVLSSAALSLREAEKVVTDAGLEVRLGEWGSIEGEEEAPYWLGVVAYKSDEAKPGLWVEAFLQEPTPSFVVESMLEEFRRHGIVKDVTLESFTAQADLNAMVFAPEELAAMAAKQSE